MSWWTNRHYLTWFLLLGVLQLQAQTPPATETLRGQFGIYIEDRFEQHFTATHYTLQTSSGNIELAFPASKDVQGLTPGSDIEVTGHLQGGRFIVADDAAAAKNAGILRSALRVLRRAALMPRDRAIGQRKIAIILINFNNDRSEPVDLATANETVTMLNQYFQETSYGQLTIAGEVFGYLQLPINLSCTGDYFSTITQAGIQAARNTGIELSPYQSYVFIGPDDSSQSRCPIGTVLLEGTRESCFILEIR